MIKIYILGIETSCDETSAAIVKDGRKVLSNVVYSQVKKHSEFGGVVPEIASRLHVDKISHITKKAIKDANININEINLISATYAPGLIGSLLVGLNFSKALSLSLNLPFLGIHHIRGHIASNYISHNNLKPPFLCLIVSGGHSHIINVKDYNEYIILGRTVDDAAGEVFDKIARRLKLPYPGGIEIEKIAKHGNENAFSLPYPELKNKFDFSFSGIKTSVLNLINKSEQKNEVINKNDLAASFQKQICKILTRKTIQAAKEFNIKKIAIAGGVSSNNKLREYIKKACDENNFTLFLPDKIYCCDNAAMIASQAYYEFLNGNTHKLNLNAISSMEVL